MEIEIDKLIMTEDEFKLLVKVRGRVADLTEYHRRDLMAEVKDEVKRTIVSNISNIWLLENTTAVLDKISVNQVANAVLMHAGKNICSS